MLNLNQMFPFLKYKPGAKPGQCKRSAESTSEKSGDDKKKERKWVEAWRQERADWLEYDTEKKVMTCKVKETIKSNIDLALHLKLSSITIHRWAD